MIRSHTSDEQAPRAPLSAAARAGGVGLLAVLLCACGGGSAERQLLNLVKAEYEGRPGGCLRLVSHLEVQRFPVRNFGFRDAVNRDFAVLVANDLVRVSQVRDGNRVGEEYSLTRDGERYFQAGTGLCFAELSVNRLVDVSAPFEERGRTHMTATAEMSVSVPRFALEDRFVQFVRGHGTDLNGMLAAARAGEPYRVELDFISTDGGWQIQ